MINPFDYWEFDPNGYIRHLIVGGIASILCGVFRLNILLVAGMALLKEGHDLVVKHFFDTWDVVFTLIPATLFLKTMNTITIIFLSLFLIMLVTAITIY